ncbi:MAG: shikimate kinase AroK [Gammaproteobacteria bacterium]|nr:shikimate kinase AroK [Gammaproteobacteria bacterium]NIM74158.1 shikimate kinase AroK [Gammaproteobacteria bacterium]NIN39041.1 shikimate kinase AroK [Gammaproteobacteria bacterium]NIO25934.1 shikimate kinase AroK [Gammaproteobacteria bacterium]NIO66565.1 shikimate kinase AroK [Gammaproteobacteria bacterium]
MKVPNNIFLIGPMGAGKSTVGRQLAKALEKEFVDCDREIEERTGVTIAVIFEVEGEEGFRKRERAMIEQLTERDDIVLATGGGAVLDEENRSRLRARGFAIYLDAPIDLLVERTARDRQRPLLQTDDPKAKLAMLAEEREPLYRQVADMVVKTDRRTARHVVKEIVRRISQL